MERKEIERKVSEFLISEFEVDESLIRPEARLHEDLGIDSLDVVDIVVLVDQIFGFRIVPEELIPVVTLNDFCDYVERKINQKKENVNSINDAKAE